MPSPAIIATALLAPGDLSVDDFLAGQNAVTRLDIDSPVTIGGAVPDLSASLPVILRPRAVELALRVTKRLQLDPEAHYGLVLGLSNLHAEPAYLEHALAHRDDPEGMRQAAAFRGSGPLDSVSRSLGITGPRVRVDSACASGSDALILGAQWLESGYVEDVVVVAAAAMLDPVGLALFRNLRALSPSNELDASRPFDSTRDGFVMGEGAAAVWLSSRQPSSPQAWIAGSGRSMNAFKMTDMPSDPGSMIACCRSAAGRFVDEIGYVSAHGTSTPANDRTETRVHHRLFERRAQDVPLSSLKSMTGHCLGASSLMEIVVTVDSMQRGAFIPTLHLNHPDPECDLNYLANGTAHFECEFALANAYAFGGQNSSVLLARNQPR